LIKSIKTIITIIEYDTKINSSKYYLGRIWDFLGPISTFCLYIFVFSYILKSKGQNDEPYIQYFLIAYLPWVAISESIMISGSSISKYKFLIKKTAFRIEYIPISLAIKIIKNHIIFLLIILLFLYLFNDGLEIKYIQIFLNLFQIFLLITTIFYINSIICVYFSDLNQIFGIVTNIIFWLTPIAWVSSGAFYSKVLAINSFNPIYHLINDYRCVILSSYCTYVSIEKIFIMLIISIAAYKFFIFYGNNIKDEL
jgi:teichoic acid transport system permease protein